MPRLALRPVVLIAVLALMAVIVGAQAPAVQNDVQETARIVVDLLEREHMARPVIDDETAKRWFDNYIKDLDPGKYCFLKSDIEEFRKDISKMDDEIREGNIDFAQRIFNRYLERETERFQNQLDLLGQKQDFSLDETMPDEPGKLDFPADKKEAMERTRKKVKFDLLFSKVVEELKDADAVHKWTVRYRDRNRLAHQIDTEDILQIYLTSLTKTFDPHSSYLGPKDLEDMLNQQLHLQLEGIGASLRSEDGYAVVNEVIPDMAADRDGRLQPEDKIIGIQKEDGEEIDLVEKDLRDVVRYIRGPRGTKVRLIVQPDGTKERRIYEITRERVELKEQHAKSKVLEAKLDDGKPFKIGIISLPAFYGNTVAILRGDPNAVSATADCRKMLREFKEQNVDVVLVDLRDNGGGLLEEAKTLSGLFIDTGPVVQVKQVQGVKPLEDDNQGAEWEGPLVVLINKASASASEIFAGVIKDYGRGLIIGDSSTFGKGTVQSIVMIADHARRANRRNQPNRGALKLTIQQFYRANGDSTQIHGVAPHIHIKSLNDYRDFNEAKMDYAIKFDKVDPLPHDNYNRTPDDLVARLNTLSEVRRKKDPKFQKLDEQIQKLIDGKKRHSISLNETKFRNEFVLADPDDRVAQEKAKREKKKKKFTEREVWASDFYNDEVVRIVADYLSLGSKALAAAPVRAKVAEQ